MLDAIECLGWEFAEEVSIVRRQLSHVPKAAAVGNIDDGDIFVRSLAQYLSRLV